MYHETTGDVFVLCQTSEKILKISLNDPCDLGSATAYGLSYVASSARLPTCSVTPTMTACSSGSVSCSPHDFAWLDETAYEDYLFVTLPLASQAIVVSAADPSDQWGFVGRTDMTTFQPLEAEAVSDP